MAPVQSSDVSIAALQRRGGSASAAWVLLTATYLTAAFAVVLYLLVRPVWHVGQWYFLVDLADAVVYGAVAFVLIRRACVAVVWIVGATALGGAVAAASSQWTQYQEGRSGVPRLALFASAQSWAWIPGTLALILVAPWLVRRRPLDAIARFGAVVGALVAVGHTTLRWTDPYPWPNGPSTMPFAVHSLWWTRQLEWLDRAFMAAIVVVGLGAASNVAWRWWHLESLEERRGLGWLAIGGALMACAFAPLALPVTWTASLPVWTTPSVHLVSQLFFPAALLVAVLGQQLWGLQLAVSRTVGWSLLTAVLVASYVAVVSLIGVVVPDLTDGVGRVAAAATVATAIDPVRRFVQRRVDRLVHGDAGEPLAAVHRISGALGSTDDPGALLSTMLHGVTDSLRLRGASIDLANNDQSTTLSVGRVGGLDDVSLPLSLDDHSVGALTVSPRPGERLDQRTLRTLDALLPTLAVAALLAVKVGELADSRSRLLSVRDEERRALRRELHDGFGPALAGIGYGLEAARNLLVTDPAAADDLLGRLGAEIDTRVEDVRAIARDLVPPILLELGLGAALAELGKRHRLSGVEMHVDVEIDRAIPAEIAATLYGLVAEAARNVVRHAQAATCTIRLQVDERHITAQVLDDGVGFDADVVSGVGLQSMRERATTLGGQLTISDRPGGGSIVQATVPLRAWRETS